MPTEQSELTIARFINAPPAVVWKAWSTPEHLAKWWIPAPIECHVVKLDLHPGGGFKTRMREDAGEFQPHVDGCFLEIVPEAQQVISYRVPAFRVRGQTVGGFAAFKDHLSYLPFSGSVLEQLATELDGYTTTKSSLHFPLDRPLPKALVKKLIAVRLAEIG